MSAIDRHIQEWRSAMLQKEVFVTEDLDELESHLRDEIDSLCKTGLTGEEAFLISAHRLGDGDQLGKEFVKLNSGTIWKQRIMWMVGGYFLLNCFLTLIYAAQSAYLYWIHWGTLTIPSLGRQYPLPIIPSVLAILLICLLYFGLTKKPSQFGRSVQLAQAGRQRKILVIFLLLAAITTTLVGGNILQLFFFRTASPQMIGQISIANSLFNAAFKLLLAILFVRLAVRFLLGKKEKTEALS
jgi:hypothetical protein